LLRLREARRAFREQTRAAAAELPQPWSARQDANRVLFNNGFSGLLLQVLDKK
jgi:hypothetical protein